MLKSVVSFVFVFFIFTLEGHIVKLDLYICTMSLMMYVLFCLTV